MGDGVGEDRGAFFQKRRHALLAAFLAGVKIARESTR